MSLHTRRSTPASPPTSATASALPGLLLLLLLAGCGSEEGRAGEPESGVGVTTAGADYDVGTPSERGELFDSIQARTLRRDAFASLPDHPYWQAHPEGIDIAATMAPWRDSLEAADTPERLYYALAAISNLRRDRHLRLPPVEGGLPFPDTFGIEEALANGLVEGSNVLRAAVRIRPDYGASAASAAAAGGAGADGEDGSPSGGRWAEGGAIELFVADHARSGPGSGADGGVSLAPGDRILSVNGMSVAAYAAAVEPWHRVSSRPGFLWWLGTWIPQRTVQIPARFYGEALHLEVERRADGSRYEVILPYVDPATIQWAGHWERRYPGFSHQWSSGTFDLWLPDDDRPVVLLQWHRFDGDLPEAMDRLMAQAESEGWLDRGVIVDATRSGGGSRGAYALQRLQPRPFRGTAGNMRVSDAMEAWVEDRIQRLRRDPATATETVDEGAWLLEWLETDVRLAIAEGRRYTNDVPFKLAHLPKHADGIIDPAPTHFRGGLVVLLGPKGGSHLDQFAAQVGDNGVGILLGMSAGGYSNTWQAEEVLRFPSDGRPILGYMYSMGHTIRPNGQILQYSPAPVDEEIPLTGANFLTYHADLIDRALQLLPGALAGRP
jgi:hypothetical protein